MDVVDGSDPDFAERDLTNLGRRVTNGATILFAVTMASRATTLLSTIVMARLLTPADFGIVALAFAILAFLEVISDLQVGGQVIRSQAVDRAHLDTAFTIQLIRGVLMAALLAGSAHVAARFFEMPALEPVMYALAGVPIASSFANPYFTLFERNLNFRPEFWRTLLSILFGFAVGVVFALIFRSYWALVLGAYGRVLASVVLSHWRTPGRPGFSLGKAKEMMHFGGWLTLSGIVDYLNNKLDYVLVGRLNARDLGAYHVGQQITVATTGDLVGALSRVLFPAFSAVSADTDRLHDSYRRSQAVVIGLAMPIGFGLCVLGRDLVLVLFGTAWLQAAIVIQFLAPNIALQTMVSATDALALALGRTGTLFSRTLTIFLVRATLLIAGYWFGGFMGIIYARLFAGWFYLAYHLHMAGRLTGTPFWQPFANAWRSLASASVMVIVLLLLQQLGRPDPSYLALVLWLMAEGAAAIVVYFAMHLGLWVAAGKPDGAEARVVETGRRIAARLRPLPSREGSRPA